MMMFPQTYLPQPESAGWITHQHPQSNSACAQINQQ